MKDNKIPILSGLVTLLAQNPNIDVVNLNDNGEWLLRPHKSFPHIYSREDILNMVPDEKVENAKEIIPDDVAKLKSEKEALQVELDATKKVVNDRENALDTELKNKEQFKNVIRDQNGKIEQLNKTVNSLQDQIVERDNQINTLNQQLLAANQKQSTKPSK